MRYNLRRNREWINSLLIEEHIEEVIFTPDLYEIFNGPELPRTRIDLLRGISTTVSVYDRENSSKKFNDSSNEFEHGGIVPPSSDYPEKIILLGEVLPSGQTFPAATRSLSQDQQDTKTLLSSKCALAIINEEAGSIAAHSISNSTARTMQRALENDKQLGGILPSGNFSSSAEVPSKEDQQITYSKIFSSLKECHVSATSNLFKSNDERATLQDITGGTIPFERAEGIRFLKNTFLPLESEKSIDVGDLLRIYEVSEAQLEKTLKELGISEKNDAPSTFNK